MRELTKKSNQRRSIIPTLLRTPQSARKADPLLQLQRTVGNQAVLRSLREQHSPEASNAANGNTQSIVDEALRSPGQSMDQNTRQFMESRFEHDFSKVRLHTGEKAAEAADTLHANAFTAGRHIVFGKGKFAPNTSEGQRLLTHELTHTVQQTSAPKRAGTLVQRDAQTEKEVKAVKSENVTLREKELKTAETQLSKRMAKRQAEIQQMLDEIGPNPKSEASKTRKEALENDLAKDLATIIKEPDSKSVFAGLRKDIIGSAKYVDAEKLKLKGAQDQWSKYDAIFAGQEVATALGKQTITAAEFKALVAQESGDLTENDTKGDKAGVAQLGKAEEKIAGAKPGDRLVPDKALVIAAKVLSEYASQLDKGLKEKPEGADRKKFIMGAYNSGVGAILRAQVEAIKMGRNGKTWQSLIDGGKESPLYKAIVATYPKGTDYAATYQEKSEYPRKILGRIP